MKYWVGAVSREHVKRGVKLGIAQIGHGKRGGLARMHADDWLIYYSPRESLDGNDPVQAFTAIGQIPDDEIWEADEGSFKPWRRKVEYKQATDAPIRPLLDQLSFTKGKKSWGYAFRYGLFPISQEDFEIIAKAMGVKV